ncbi:MAG TPA: FAD-dependent thymidylate synthase [Gaiellales bacterium]|jgi:thymidylate synthase (FAD)
MSTDVVDARKRGSEEHGPGAIPVLDHGFVRLDGCMADDLSVVNAARVSFAQRSDDVGERDQGLIRFLMRERHGTPFEHNAFRFHVKLPIFVMREWARHRMGSFNEWSARYSQLDPEFYVPEPQDVRTQVGKPGSYSFDPVDPELAEHTRETQLAVYERAYAAYADLLERGVAKEVARNVLPVAIYTQFYWTVNARSLMNFLSLRNAVTAQREIRHYAAAVEQLFAEKMPITHSAFVANDRRAP